MRAEKLSAQGMTSDARRHRTKETRLSTATLQKPWMSSAQKRTTGSCKCVPTANSRVRGVS